MADDDNKVNLKDFEDPREENYIGLCVDCGSPQNEQQMMKDPFVNAGLPTTCRFCGGVVHIVPESRAEHIMEQRRNTGRIIG